LSKITKEQKKGTLTLQRVAEYSISGKILSKKKYGSTWSARLAPYDLAIGWAKLASPDLIEKIKYSQWGRFYFFKHDWDVPVKAEYIIEHSSNSHIIPATENLEKLLFHIKKHDLIKLEGFLVDVTGTIGSDRVRWFTSLERNDTGNGSCEIFYVTKITHDKKIYE